MSHRAVAFAPASVANVAVGFDLLGFSVGVAGDRVTVEKTDAPGVRIEKVTGVVTTVPADPTRNTATAGLVKMLDDLKLKTGLKVSIEKGIPLGSGMGGSAASAVAAVVAANHLLENRFTNEELLSYALIGEAQASGSFHADNLAPSLYGGLTLARVQESENAGLPKVKVTRIPMPQGIACVLLHPNISVETKQARGILKDQIGFKEHIAQSANLSGFIAGCFTSDLELIARSLADLIVEPQRGHLIPGFQDVKNAALSHGALGCSISGAGPSVFAWAPSGATAKQVELKMVEAFKKANVPCSSWTVPLQQDGARIIV